MNHNELIRLKAIAELDGLRYRQQYGFSPDKMNDVVCEAHAHTLYALVPASVRREVVGAFLRGTRGQR